jgi:hypothetical protein
MAPDATNGAASVDATALLGMMAGLSRTIISGQSAADELYLAFPISPLPYRADDLRFGLSATPSPQQARAFGEFSELVNRIPRVSAIWASQGAEHLWDVYGAVLQAVLAKDTLSHEQRSRFEEHLELLYDTDAQGVQQPSPMLRDYLTYQEKWLAAVSALAAAADGQKEALEAARDLAMANWEALGHRDAVGAALEAVDAVRDQAPETIWASYRRRFDPSEDTSYMTTVDGMRFAPSPFSPSGAIDAGMPWPRLSLDRAQLSDLAGSDSVPEQMRLLLQAQANADDTVQGVEFDFLPVDVIRSWAELSALTSRVWKFPDGERALFDPGLGPEEARCPAYVTGVVLARRVAVQTTVADASPLGPLDVAGIRRLLDVADLRAPLDPQRLRAVRLQHVGAAVTLAAETPILAAQPASEPPAADAIAVDCGLRTVSPLLAERAGLRAMLTQPVDGVTEAEVSTRALVLSRIARPLVSLRAAEILALRRRDVEDLEPFPEPEPAPQPEPAADPPPPSPADPAPAPERPPVLTTTQTPDDLIFIVAFICRRLLPTAPNPDPHLSFG